MLLMESVSILGTLAHWGANVTVLLPEQHTLQEKKTTAVKAVYLQEHFTVHIQGCADLFTYRLLR